MTRSKAAKDIHFRPLLYTDGERTVTACCFDPENPQKFVRWTGGRVKLQFDTWDDPETYEIFVEVTRPNLKLLFSSFDYHVKTRNSLPERWSYEDFHKTFKLVSTKSLLYESNWTF